MLLVETTGDFMFVSPHDREVIEAHRPSVVHSCPFVQEKISIGALKILIADLPEEANDEEWNEWLKASEGKLDLAVASYAAKFKPESKKK